MIKRPLKTDSEKEILAMQNEFLAEKERNPNFQPAAKFIKVNKPEVKVKKQSEFAKKRGHTHQDVGKKQDSENNKLIILGEIVENKIDDNVTLMEIDIKDNSNGAFPKPEKINVNLKSERKSLFATLREEKQKVESSELQQMDTSFQEQKDHSELFGNKSNIVVGEYSKEIHEENVNLLKEMSENELAVEKQKLLDTLDPKLIDFLKSRRNVKITETKVEKSDDKIENEIPDLDILSLPEANNWLNFNVIEKEKLEWMKNIKKQMPNIKPGEPFEARFDWKGILLPFAVPEDSFKDNRELYLHGDEAHRPGYTMQELFRLARSTIKQQRMSALGAIAGILNIYNQGFYDEVLDLPLSKIFFLLRFALDESISSIIEIAAKGLSYIFYNETDEVLLDVIFDSERGLYQPSFEKIQSNIDYRTVENIEDKFANMSMSTNNPVFKTTIDEEEMINAEQLNDFHLAETDLIQCLLRTNILERIRYIVSTIKPDNSTITSCLKILIRIARDSKDAAKKIIQTEGLVDEIIKYFLPSIDAREGTLNEFYGKPQQLVLKLLRIIIGQDISFDTQHYGIVDILKNYIYSRKDINIDLIVLQIESFRLLRTLLEILSYSKIYYDFLSAFRYILEWHYQYLIFENDKFSSLTIRQHAAALIATLNHQLFDWDTNICSSTLIMCFNKWFTMATRHNLDDFSQLILLQSCLELGSTHMSPILLQFINIYLDSFVKSKNFINLTEILLMMRNEEQQKDRSAIHEALPNLGSIVFIDGKSGPNLIMSQKYPGLFLNSILGFISSANTSLTSYSNNTQVILERLYTENIINFIKIATKNMLLIKSNWFKRYEIYLLINLIKVDYGRNFIPRDVSFNATLILLSCMGQEFMRDILWGLQNVIFNIEFYPNPARYTQNDLDNFRTTYIKCYLMLNNIFQTHPEPSVTIKYWNIVLLPLKWPYSLLTKILEQHTTKQTFYLETDIEDYIIRTSLSFIELLESNSIDFLTPTEKLMYLMMIYLSSENRFLLEDIKQLLRNRIDSLFRSMKDILFNFDTIIDGKHDFENFYTLFLNHFQGSSYGDDLFSALIMVPLSQKYDCKWRKMVWSEHVAVLRFITCREEQLCGHMENYLMPIETDLSLLKCYSQALNSNILRIDSIPFKIAKHHVEEYKLKLMQK